MNWNPDWDLSTIPREVIPDEILRGWWASRNGSRGGGMRNIQRTPEERARMDAQAERKRKIRRGELQTRTKPQVPIDQLPKPEGRPTPEHILRLVEAGYTQAQIGVHCALSTRSIAKIVKRARVKIER